MPIKEGRCPNCGSILTLDTAAEKGHCLFCDAVFENSQAFAIAEDPGAYTFPNLPQPKYEGPSLEPVLTKGQGGSHGQVQKPKKKPKPAPPPVYIPKEPVKLPDIRLPRKIKLRILLIALVLILIIAGISIPVVLNRNAVRQTLLDSVDELAPFTVDAGRDVAIWHTANNYVMVATADSVTEQQMIAFFKAFCEKRAEAAGLDPLDFGKVYGQMTIKLVSPDGGFLIDQPASLAALDSGEAIKILP